MKAKINYKRMLDTFLQLIKVEAPSYEEAKMQVYVEKELKNLGCKVITDNAGSKFPKKSPTNAKGNVMGFLPGAVKSEPIILCCHLDSVTPCKGIKAKVSKDKVTSDGTTILSADDRAGIAMAFEILRVLKESKAQHPPVEVLFTLCEEAGMHGAKNLEVKHLKGKEGMVLDTSSNKGLAVTAPQAYEFTVQIKGIAAHSGIEPEKGISALEVAAYALSIMKLGRIDKETVANFGIVSGGEAVNVVMPALTLRGEARSINPPKLKKQLAHIKDCFAKAEKKFTKKIDGKTAKPIIEIEMEEKYPLLKLPANAPIMKHIISCAKAHGVEVKPVTSGGGSDANVLASKGLVMPIMGIGYFKAHTTAEWLDLKMYNQSADIALDVVLNYKK